MTIQIKSSSQSSTGSPSQLEGNYHELPDSADTETTRQFFADRINDLIDQVDRLTLDLKRQRTELEKQSSRNIEIIGIFSGILALIIIDVSIIKSVTTFLSAILLIVGMTCSLSIFVVLIHQLFGNNISKKLGLNFWIPIGILILLIIIGCIAYSWQDRIIIQTTPTDSIINATST